MWRNDGRCGDDYPLPNGTAAECDPDGENPCCSDTSNGWCGNTTEHSCSCPGCTDYKFAKEWRESGGTQMWRNDGRCGDDYPLPNGTAAECDPDGTSPCCSDYGQCGNALEYCSCHGCIDYKLTKEWRESGGKRWTSDGKCGIGYPLPDGRAAECDPDGENPCCSDEWKGQCGKTAEHCSCSSCTDYKLAKEWREGKLKWRYDGKCGEAHPFPDGTASECNPDGKHPCCNAQEDGVCGNSDEHCICDACVDYNLVKKMKESDEACIIAQWGGGFLKYVCFNATARRMNLRCAFSDIHYDTSVLIDDVLYATDVCKNDPHMYQACGVNFDHRVTNEDVLCGGYFCEKSDDSDRSWSRDFDHKFIECPGNDCKVDNRNCSTTRSDEVDLICDDKCDMGDCKDESECNGYRYGVNCGYGLYISVSGVCYGYSLIGGESICGGIGKEDIRHCKGKYLNGAITCIHYLSKVMSDKDNSLEVKDLTVPILNYTRCSPFKLPEIFDHHKKEGEQLLLLTYPYCLNYLDQTNCSDIERVGGYCRINGYMSAVSKYVVCYDYDHITGLSVEICDDNFQNECLSPSIHDCRIHKHKMCDGEKNCPGGTDELHDMCKTMTDTSSFVCTRAFNTKNTNITIPISWIMDNVTDCLNGEDEDESRWKFCQGDSINQLILPGKNCQDVFKCPHHQNNKSLPNSNVQFDQLCDGVESCENGGENEVCTIARDFPDIDKLALYTSGVRNVCISESCQIRKFKRDSNKVFGVTLETELLVPTLNTYCNDTFGEYYVFLSCMGLCLETDITCPLDVHENENKLVFNSCPGQFPNRTYTVVNKSYLTFVVKTDKNHYHQELYQCNNSRCVEYKQVCDLIDDCGDMSDEEYCKNHMICEDTLNSSKHQFISLSQKCDGIYDCFDLSDECNDNCGREILGNWVLKIICWFMGILAMLFNLFTSVNGFLSLKDCETSNMMTSKALMSLIGSGDFLIGVYLVILSVYDSIIFGKDFCRFQDEWLTGTACLTLGVISTLGSQISLFTMTVLSVIRMYGLTCKPMRVPGPVTKKSVLKLISLGVVTMTAALAIAVTPLIPSLEDYFVQGMYYNSTYKVFVGFPNKDRHVNILKTYFNQSKTENITNFSPQMSWSEIGQKVDSMFTQNEGQLTRKAVHFYGNDGVCLFKYFVRTDDARRSRQSLDPGNKISGLGDPVVWTMLSVNLFCFIVITCCYIIITWRTKQSSQRSGQNDNLERQKNERAIQNKIMVIIATDFLCWVPFIVISALHNLDYIDASKWYATFAMTVLPLNSVINPLLYDKALGDLMSASLGKIKHFLGISSITRAIRGLFMCGAAEIEQQVQAPQIVTIGRINQIQPESEKGDNINNDNDNYNDVIDVAETKLDSEST